jgi:hypothetical protein
MVNDRPPKGEAGMDTHTFLAPLIQFYRARRRMPSVQELTTLYGFRSKNATTKVLAKLLAAGLVAKDPTGKILPTDHFAPLRVKRNSATPWIWRTSSFATRKPPIC